MTDLSMLFSSHLVNKKLEAYSSQPKPSKKPIEDKHSSSSQKNPHWNLADLQSSLRKGIKKQVPQSSLSEQLQSFNEKQRQQYIKKALIFGGIILIIQFVLSLNHKITFHLIFFTLLKLISVLPLKAAQSQIIRNTGKLLTPVIYSALFYYLLKSITNANIYEFSASLTFTTIVYMAVFLAVQCLQPLYTLSIQHLLLRTAESKPLLKKTELIVGYLQQRVKFFVNIKGIFFWTLILTTIVQAAVLLFLKAQIFSILDPISYIYGLCIFISLQIWLLTFRFIDSWFLEVRVVRNKMPIFMSLLRLQGKSLYRKAIHGKCLLYILSQMSRIKGYLSTETCKSLVYDTYMDVFSQCASIQLQRAQSCISNELLTVNSKQLTLQSKKTLSQDAFITCRKIFAFFIIQKSILNSLLHLSQTIAWMRVITLSDEHAAQQKQTIRIQPRVLDMLAMIEGKLNRLAQNQIVLSFMRSQLVSNERKLKGWLNSIRTGWI